MVVTLPCSYRSTCFPNKSADRCPAGRAPSLPLQQAVLSLPQGPEQVVTRLISHTYAPTRTEKEYVDVASWLNKGLSLSSVPSKETILYHTEYSFFGPVSPYDGITISKKQVQ